MRQLEGYNCGPIACPKILETFGLVTKFGVNNAYGLGTIRNLVTEQWKRFLIRCTDDLIVHIVQRQPIAVLREEYASKGGNMTSQADTRTFDPLDICFCFDDEPHIDIVRLVCCKEFMHRYCLLTWLKFESSCLYCRRPIDDIASIQHYPVIDRMKDLPSTPTLTPKQRGIGRKRDIQEMELNEAFGAPTPQRLVDKMRSISQEKKRDSQIKQAAKMVATRSKDIKKMGGGIGAVVTGIPDHRAVRHSVSIVGIVYKMKEQEVHKLRLLLGYWCSQEKKTGGYLMINTSCGTRHTWTRPFLSISRRYVNLFLTAHITQPQKQNGAPLHKVITNQVSPQKMGKCSCLKGKCNPKRCGCATCQRKCTSACTCNGNCTNPQNGK